uniref:Uncharacterized protein n=1 Tax=viral metagenome TaxID=1070528 RepID=A0A6C0KVN0_9ZZZZ
MSWLSGIVQKGWGDSDSEEEDYEEGTQEIPIEGIDPTFVNNVINIMKHYYDLTVNAQPLGTSGAQTMDSLDDFEKRLAEVYTFLSSVHTLDKMNRNEMIKEFTKFPENIRQENGEKIMELREELHNLIDNWILTQYNHAKTEDLPQYRYFLKQKLIMCTSEFNKSWCKNPDEPSEIEI